MALWLGPLLWEIVRAAQSSSQSNGSGFGLQPPTNPGLSRVTRLANTGLRLIASVLVGAEIFQWMRKFLRWKYPVADQDELVGMCVVAALEALANGYDHKRGPFKFFLMKFVIPGVHEEYLRSVGAVRRPAKKLFDHKATSSPTATSTPRASVEMP